MRFLLTFLYKQDISLISISFLIVYKLQQQFQSGRTKQVFWNLYLLNRLNLFDKLYIIIRKKNNNFCLSQIFLLICITHFELGNHFDRASSQEIRSYKQIKEEEKKND